MSPNYTFVVYGGHVLAGIVISVLVVAGLAVAVPWLVAHRETPDAVDGDPTERFSDSMRIVRRDVEDFAEELEGAEVSTPLIRRAELTELRLLARSAARRRARTASLLVALVLVTVGVAAFGVAPWWVVAIPGSFLAVFLIASPFMVRAMNRRFDARAQKLVEGYTEDEMTEVIHVEDAAQEKSTAIRVDLGAPEDSGTLWEAAPVTAPTYVSKPLVARTVRTIDLSQPVVEDVVVPTADHPSNDVEEIELEDTESIEHLRVVGE